MVITKEEVGRRLSLILEELYGGNITRFADVLEVDRSSASRYKDGTVVQDRRSLILLSNRTGVSLDWLERGGSDEIRYEPDQPRPEPGTMACPSCVSWWRACRRRATRATRRRTH